MLIKSAKISIVRVFLRNFMRTFRSLILSKVIVLFFSVTAGFLHADSMDDIRLAPLKGLKRLGLVVINGLDEKALFKEAKSELTKLGITVYSKQEAEKLPAADQGALQVLRIDYTIADNIGAVQVSVHESAYLSRKREAIVNVITWSDFTPITPKDSAFSHAVTMLLIYNFASDWKMANGKK
jgi:hypothetical protein